MRKNLFLVVPLLDYGGQERFVATLSQILKNDFNIFIILFKKSEIGYDIDCELRFLEDSRKTFWDNFGFSRFIKKCLKLRSLKKQYNPSACISFGVGANLVNILSKANNIKTMISLRSFLQIETYKKFPHNIEILKADSIICVSEEIRQRMQIAFPAHKNKFLTVYNAYDTSKIKRITSTSHKENGEIRFITLGRIHKSKGFHHLIKAFYLALQNNDDISLHIFGSFQDETLTKQLVELCESLHVTGKVFFEGNSSEPYLELGKSDVYVLSSIIEGFPNSLVEAMACGLPVIADDCLSGPREILNVDLDQKISENMVTEYGVLTPRFTNETDMFDPTYITSEERAFADAIVMLAKDSEMRKNMGIAATNRANDFSLGKCREDFIGIINS